MFVLEVRAVFQGNSFHYFQGSQECGIGSQPFEEEDESGCGHQSDRIFFLDSIYFVFNCLYCFFLGGAMDGWMGGADFMAFFLVEKGRLAF